MLLLTFTAGANVMPSMWRGVIELVPRVELRAIPHAPAFLAGLLGYRGEVVPVIDLGVVAGLVPLRGSAQHPDHPGEIDAGRSESRGSAPNRNRAGAMRASSA